MKSQTEIFEINGFEIEATFSSEYIAATSGDYWTPGTGAEVSVSIKSFKMVEPEGFADWSRNEREEYVREYDEAVASGSLEEDLEEAIEVREFELHD